MLLFLFVLAALASWAERWSENHALDGVTCRHRPDRRLTEPDAPFYLVTEVQNASRRFVPFIRIRETVPRELTLLDEGLQVSAPSKDSVTLLSSVYLMPRQLWQRKVQCSLPCRGRFVFQGGSLQGGDFLGLSETTVYLPQAEEIVVIPARCEDPELLDTVGGFLGDRSVDRFIQEDPVLTLGFRDYTGREPMKSISWTQSARSGRLMVKKYDYTLELTATVVMNIEISHEQPGWETRLEKCFSLARTVCETLEEKHIQYRFLTNASAAGAFRLWSSVSDGLSQAHLDTILEGLGRATYDYVRPFDVILAQAARGAEQGRTHILILPERDPRYEEGIRRLEQLSGTRVLVLTPKEAQS